MKKRAGLIAAALIAVLLCMGCGGEKADDTDRILPTDAAEENAVSETAATPTVAAAVKTPSDMAEAEEAVTYYQSVFGTQWSFVGVMEERGDSYYGSWIYEDETNRYYYMPDEAYLAAVENKNIVPVEELEEEDMVSAEEIKESAEALFCSCNALTLVGEYEITMSDFDGVSYSVEIIETLDGFETGTKALLLYGADGILCAAAFLKGTEYTFETDEMLTEAEALERAVGFVNKAYGNEWRLIEDKEITGQIKSDHGKTYWSLTFSMNRENKLKAYIFTVNLEAYTGELIDIDTDFQ